MVSGDVRGGVGLADLVTGVQTNCKSKLSKRNVAEFCTSAAIDPSCQLLSVNLVLYGGPVGGVVPIAGCRA